MKKFLALLVLSLCMLDVVHAATYQDPNKVDISGLSEEDKQKIAAQIEASKKVEKTPENISTTARKEAQAWGELGANMGKALVGGAKEIGMAANDFASTPLGKVTVAIVTYKLIGRDIIKFFIGTAILIVGYTVGIKLLFKFKHATNFEYHPRLWGLYNKKVVTKYETIEADERIGLTLLSVASLVLSSLVGLKIIFS